MARPPLRGAMRFRTVNGFIRSHVHCHPGLLSYQAENAVTTDVAWDEVDVAAIAAEVSSERRRETFSHLKLIRARLGR